MSKKPGDVRRQVRRYYDRVGWAETADGRLFDIAVNVDPRMVKCAWRRGGKPAGFPQAGRRFLDARCGANPRRHLAEGFEAHVCVDLSEVGLAKALAKLQRGAVAAAADLTRLPMADATFDAISCENVLYHMVPADQIRAFRELYRVLCPGGQLWIGYSKGTHWLPERVLLWLRPLIKGLLPRVAGSGSHVRDTERSAPPGQDPGGDQRPPAATLFYEPLPVQWWRELLRSLGVRYRFAPRAWIGGRWTRPLPRFLAVSIVRVLAFLCRRFPRAALLLAQHYHIVVSKPGSD